MLMVMVMILVMILVMMVYVVRLDLDKWINVPPSDSSDEDVTAASSSIFAPSTDHSTRLVYTIYHFSISSISL